MANISYSPSRTRCQVRLTNLDEGWLGGKRLVSYLAYEVGTNSLVSQVTDEIEGAPPQSNHKFIEGLLQATQYYIKWTVYDIENNYTILDTRETSIFTTKTDGDISASMTEIQYFYDSSQLKTKWSVRYAEYGKAEYYINDSLKSSRNISYVGTSFSTTFANASTYTAKEHRLEVTTDDGVTVSNSIDITLMPFTVTQSSRTMEECTEAIVRIQTYEDNPESFENTTIFCEELDIQWVLNGSESEGYDNGNERYYEYTWHIGNVNKTGTLTFILTRTYAGVTHIHTTTAEFKEPYKLEISNLQCTYGYKSVTFTCDNTEAIDATNYSVQYLNDKGNWAYWGNSTEPMVKCSGSFGLTRDMRMRATRGSLSGNSLTETVTIPPAPPTISLIGGQGRITVNYSTTHTTYIDSIMLNLYDENNHLKATHTIWVEDDGSQIQPAGSYAFSGLEDGTYYVKAITYKNGQVCFTEENANFVSSELITITGFISVVTPWSWDTSNGEASDTQTQNSYNAINKVEGYNINDFSYLVWNDLVDKVYKVATLDGGWLTAKADGSVTYLSYNQTKMTPEDKTLTAQRFNALKFNIGAPTNSPGTGIEDVSKNDPVYGWYFTELTSALNTWIDNING